MKGTRLVYLARCYCTFKLLYAFYSTIKTHVINGRCQSSTCRPHDSLISLPNNISTYCQLILFNLSHFFYRRLHLRHLLLLEMGQRHFLFAPTPPLPLVAQRKRGKGRPVRKRRCCGKGKRKRAASTQEIFGAQNMQGNCDGKGMVRESPR